MTIRNDRPGEPKPAAGQAPAPPAPAPAATGGQGPVPDAPAPQDTAAKAARDELLDFLNGDIFFHERKSLGMAGVGWRVSDVNAEQIELSVSTAREVDPEALVCGIRNAVQGMLGGLLPFLRCHVKFEQAPRRRLVKEFDLPFNTGETKGPIVYIKSVVRKFRKERAPRLLELWKGVTDAPAR